MSEIKYSALNGSSPIRVAVQSVCSCLIAGRAVSNLSAGMGIRLLCLFLCRVGSGLCDDLINRSESPTGCVCVCLCVCVCVCVCVSACDPDTPGLGLICIVAPETRMVASIQQYVLSE